MQRLESFYLKVYRIRDKRLMIIANLTALLLKYIFFTSSSLLSDNKQRSYLIKCN